jgi:uncharacterized protein (DUF1778 family)
MAKRNDVKMVTLRDKPRELLKRAAELQGLSESGFVNLAIIALATKAIRAARSLARVELELKQQRRRSGVTITGETKIGM